jgi:hypothetical protein
MGIVKLMMPRFMFYRKFNPVNRNWRSNCVVAFVQTGTLALLLYFGGTRYTFESPKRGYEYVDPARKTSRIIPLL